MFGSCADFLWELGSNFLLPLTRCLDQKCKNITEKCGFEPKACGLLPWAFAAQQLSWEEIALLWHLGQHFSA